MNENEAITKTAESVYLALIARDYDETQIEAYVAKAFLWAEAFHTKVGITPALDKGAGNH